MDENHATTPNSPRRGSWTSRIILWALACGLGLWLGTGARTAAAGGQANGPSGAAKTAIADVFRFDILLAGKESAAQSIRPKAAPEKQRTLPAEVLIAMEQRPEPVPSAMPKTLSCARPRFMLAPPLRPGGPWRSQLEASLAGVEHIQTGLKALLATAPGMNVADRKFIEIKLKETCEQAGLLRMERAIHVPEPPQPLVGLPEVWPEPGMQLVP